MKKGFTLIELLVVIAIIGILAAMLLPTLSSIQEKANQTKCRANLSQVSKALKMYQQDFGKSQRFPEYNGGFFVTAPYRTQLLSEQAVYLCPSTPDEPNATAISTSPTQTAVKSDYATNETCSYAGRRNGSQRTYPGLFKLARDSTITSMASDDFKGAEGIGNHESGRLINIMYADGHVEGLKAAIPIDDNTNSFAEFANTTNYGNIAAPLTD